MSTLKGGLVWARYHAPWPALLALPLFVAACTNSGGSGY